MTRDHWCVAYADEADLGAVTSRYLSESQGDQVGLFGWGAVDELVALLAGLGSVDVLIGAGAARVGSFDQHFRRDEPPDPRALLAFWSDATDAAVDAGFPGLRVVADTTPWACLDHEKRVLFLQGEQLLNRYRHDHPFTLICACDASLLAGEALAETASIHPLTEGVSSPFRLHATVGADSALDGEIDAFAVPLLERVLGSVRDGDTSRKVVIDATGLGFVDHHGLLALERHADRFGLTGVVLRHASSTVGHLVELLGLRCVRVEVPR